MKRSQKPFFVDNLTEELKSATSVVLVDYTGLSVKAQQELKKALKAVNAKFVVVKNTLFKLAGEKAKTDQEVLTDAVLSGPTAMIITEDDPIAPLQVLSKFASEHDLLNLKVGIVEGQFQAKDRLEMLSKLPSKEALLAQAVGAVGAPMYGLVGTLQGNMQKLVWILQTQSKSN